MKPQPMDPEKVEEITEAARQFHEAVAEAVYELNPEEYNREDRRKLARELNKIQRDQEDIAIAELAEKLGERHSAVARVFRNYVPF